MGKKLFSLRFSPTSQTRRKKKRNRDDRQRRRSLLHQDLEVRNMWAADVTLGVARPDGGTLMDQFLDKDTIATSLPNATAEISFKFGVNSTSTLPAANTSGGGPLDDYALAGDLSGVGYDQVVVARGLSGGALQWLGDTDRDTTEEHLFRFGLNDMTPLIADMNGDGVDDVVAVDRSTVSGLNEWYIHYGVPGLSPYPTDDSVLSTDATFSFGFNADVPQVGDISGDGRADVLAIREVSADLDWFISNAASGASPYPNVTATTVSVSSTISGFGLVGEIPVVGDWDNDGDDNIGRVDEGTSPVTWRLDTDGTGGLAELNPQYGLPGDQYFAGQWPDVVWDGSVGDSRWSSSANWSGGALPALTDSVVIDQPGAVVTIDHDIGATSIEALVSTEAINITGGSIDLTAAINNVDLASVSVGGSGSLTLPDAASVDSLSSQGTLTLDGTLDTGSTSISLAGTVIGGGIGGIIADDVVLTDVTTFDASSDITVTGSISGTQPITKSGSFNLNLNSANTFTGTVTINDGTLRTGASQAIPDGGSVLFGPSGFLDLNDFDLSLSELTAIAGPEVMLGSATLTVGSGNTDFEYGGAISGTGGLIKNGTGVMTLSGMGIYSGVTEVQSGELIVIGSLGNNTGNTIVRGNATLDISGASAGDENILLDGASPTLKVGTTQISGGIALTATGLATIDSASGNISGDITGSVTGGPLAITGTDIVLSGTNTYTGDTEISTTSITMVEGGAALPATSAVSLAGTAELAVGDTGLTVGSIAGVAGTRISSGPSAMNLTTGGDNTSTTFAGVISDMFSLVKDGSGVLTLAGSNTYTGTTTVNAGTIIANEDDALGSPASAASVASNATLQIGAGVDITNAVTLADSATISGADGASQLGSITASANADVRIGAVDSDSTFNIGGGIVTGPGASINYQLPGVTSIVGNQTYTGESFLVDGELSLSASFASNLIMLTNGRLSGSGTTANVEARTTSVVAPGFSPGVINTNDFDLQVGATLEIELGGSGGQPNAGFSYDQINATGAVTLGGTLETFMISNMVAGQEYIIIANDAADAVSGTFAGIPDDSTITIGGVSVTVDYNGGDGNDVTLTPAASTTFGSVWDGEAGTLSWSDAANWSGDAVPALSSSVFIQAPAGQVISADAATVLVTTLTSANSIDVDNGTFITTGTVDITGDLRIGSATISGGTWNVTGNVGLTSATTSGQANIDGLTLNKDIAIDTNQRLRLLASPTLGDLNFIGGNTYLTINPGETINANINVTSGGSTFFNMNGAGNVTLPLGQSINVSNGELQVNGTGGFTSDGPVTASGSGRVLFINTATINGTITAEQTSGATSNIEFSALPANVSGGALAGGTWITRNQGRFILPGSGVLTAIATDVTLESPTVPSTSLGFEAPQDTDALSTLTSIVSGASLTIGPSHTRTASTALTVAGDLDVNGSLNAVSVSVDSGGQLMGSGDIIAPVTINSGASVLPGNSPGVLSTGNFDLQAGATLEVELGGLAANPGVDYDQVNVTGTVNLAGTLSPIFFSDITSGQQYVIINNDGVDAVTGTFAGVAEGDFVAASGANFQVSYVGGTGNDVVLTAQNTVTEISWDGGGDGTSWSDAANWVGDVLPASTDVVTIDDPGTPTIVSSGNVNITSLVSQEAISITGGSFSPSGSVSAPSVSIDGGSLFVVEANTSNLSLNSGVLGVQPGTVISDPTIDIAGGQIRYGQEISYTLPNNLALTGNVAADVLDGQLEFSGVISGSGGINKTGGSSLALSGNNTFDGTVEIVSSTLRLDHDNALGSQVGGVVVNDGTVLEISSGIQNADEVLMQGSSPLLRSGPGGSLAIQSGEIILAEPDTPGIVADAQLSIRGVISGNSNSTLNVGGVNANGVLQFQPSVDNTYTGSITVNDGSLQTLTSDVIAITGDVVVGNSDATRAFLSLARPNTVAPTANITLNPDAYLDLDTRNVGNAFAVNQTINDLTVTGTALAAPVQTASQIDTTSTQHGNVGLLTVAGLYHQLAGDATTEISGKIAFTSASVYRLTVDSGSVSTGLRFASGSEVVDGAVGTRLTPRGTGSVEVLGTVNTQFATEVHTPFQLGPASNVLGSTMVFGNGRLTGTGQADDLMVFVGGVIAPGDGPGIINSGNLNLQTGAILEIEVGGAGGLANAGVTYDQVNVTGTVSLVGAGDLELGFIGNVTAGNVYTIINNDAADAISGTFNGLAEGATLSTPGGDFTISYVGGDGNDVTLTAATTTYVVVNTNDSGAGSLRQAITDANALAGTQTIAFNIPGAGPHTIQPTSALPSITQSVIVDGTSEPDFAGSPVVEIDGQFAGAVDGLALSGGGTTIRGLVVNNFAADGIDVQSGNGNVIVGNWIGIDSDGITPQANVIGIRLNSDFNFVGGGTSSDRNVISGQTSTGVFLPNGSDDNTFEGNYFGIDSTGTVAVPNAAHGLATDTARRTNIGVAGGLPNVFSGNSNAGMNLFRAMDTSIVNNYIGLDASGSFAIPNQTYGIRATDAVSSVTGITIGAPGAGNVFVAAENVGSTAILLADNQQGVMIQSNIVGLDATGTNQLGGLVGITINASSTGAVIGGSGAGERNVISGHAEQGILTFANSTSIQGNYIGTDATGLVAIPNDGGGIEVDGATGVVIGSVGAGNVIATSNAVSGHGIHVVNSSVATIKGNMIGVGSDGETAISFGGNTGIRISTSAAVGTLIGDVDPGDGNVIGNTNLGIFVGAAATVSGNLVGLTSSLAAAPIQGQFGIQLAGPTPSTMSDNTIANVAGDGVSTVGGIANVIGPNSIFANSGLGIDIDGDGPDVPAQIAIDSIDFATSTVNVNLANLPASTGMTVYLYEGDSPGDSKTLLSSTAFSTDGSGAGTANFPGVTFTSGKYITAFASDAAFGTTELATSLKASIFVTNTNDSGPGSLRQAITDANALPNADIVEFVIASAGPHTIAPASIFPMITGPVTFDGYADPGASENTLAVGDDAVIEWVIDGASVTGRAFDILGDDVTIRGLSIVNYLTETPIRIDGDRNVVEGNFIGLLPDGDTMAHNLGGVNIRPGSNDTRIGTDGDGSGDAGERNLIADNSNGVFLQSASGLTTDSFGTLIAGNYFDTDRTGLLDRGNTGLQILQAATIGGTGPLMGNVISGGSTGIFLANPYGGATLGQLAWYPMESDLSDRQGGPAGSGPVSAGDFPPTGTVSGQALALPIVGAVSVSLPAPDALALDSFSIDLFATPQLSSFSAGDQIPLLFKGQSPGTESFGVSLVRTALGADVRFSYTVGGTAYDITSSGSLIHDATQHHIAVTVGDLAATIYIDGEEAIQAPLVGSIDETADPILVGSDRGDRSGINYDGLIDEVGIHGRDLFFSEVAAIAQFAGRGKSGSIIQGNLIGVGADGTTPLGNTTGIEINTGLGVFIGGFTDAARNVISSNTSDGIRTTGSAGLTIVGNYVGTDSSGSVARGNGQSGIYLDSGDRSTIVNNVISSNLGSGVANLRVEASSDVQIKGNLIGTNAAGDASLTNGVYGIVLDSGSNNVIGGTAIEDRNLLSGNFGAGVRFGGVAPIGEATTWLRANGDLVDQGGAVVVTASGGTSFVAGRGVGQSVNLNGVDGFLSLGNAIGLAAGRAFSGDGWFQPLDVASGSAQTLVSFNNPGLTSPEDELRLQIGSAGTLELATDLTVPGLTSGVTNLVDGEWFHLAFSYDGAGTTSVYLNGALEFQHTEDIGFAAAPTVRVGAAFDDTLLTGSHFFDGNVDEIAFWQNDGLTADEARRLYLGGGFAKGFNRLEGNWIGLNASGDAPLANGTNGLYEGVYIEGDGVIVGGLTSTPGTGAGNVISGNSFGAIHINNRSGVVVQGNLIGPAPDGQSTIGSNGVGIEIRDQASSGVGHNLIGGNEIGAANVISANGSHGVYIHSQSNGNRIQGNLIGTDITGTVPLSNSASGVLIESGQGNIVGADGDQYGDANEGNLISGNTAWGVRVESAGAASVIAGNLIGLNTHGTDPLGNGIDGITLVGVTGVTVGGSQPTQRNYISGNTSVGISIQEGANNNAVQGNTIGLDIVGTTAISGQPIGIIIDDVTGSVIGTDGNAVDDSAEGNVISGNDTGVLIIGATTASNVLAGNIIGLDAFGDATIGGSSRGIVLSAGTLNNRIGTDGNGTSDALERNVISGATIGIELDAAGPGNVIAGNYIGTDITGTLDRGNSQGITLTAGTGATVIGTNLDGSGDDVEGNVISGNDASGVILRGTGSLVRGNKIGTDVAGVNAIANGVGVIVDGTAQSVGGVMPLEGNIIAFNFGAGVAATSVTASGSIRGNSIFGNAGLGIDLGMVGPLANDPDDVDSGPNELQNYPTIDSASSAADTTVAGQFDSIASTTFMLDFYANPPTDTAEGKRYLGSAPVVTSPSGAATYNVSGLAATFPGEFVTVTATDPAGNTSEFSPSQPVSTTGNPTIDPEALLITFVDDTNHEETFGTPTLEINEGELLDLTGDFANATSPVVVTVNWGDGTIEPANIVGSVSFSAAHIYDDDNPSASPSDLYGVFVTATDPNGSGSALINVRVHNVDPEIDPLQTSLTADVIDEGGAVTLNGVFTDPGVGDFHTLHLDWGDGSAIEEIAIVQGARDFTATHTYNDDGQFEIRYSVFDDDRDAALPSPGDVGFVFDASTIVTAVNLPPTGSVDVDAFHEEGDIIPISANVFDSGGDPISQEWVISFAGEQIFSSESPAFDFVPTESGLYSIELLLSDGQEETLVMSAFTVTNPRVILNASDLVVASPTPGILTEGDTITLGGTFLDKSPLDEHTVTVDFGDGTPSETLVLELGARGFDGVTHTYVDDPTNALDEYQVVVSIDDGQDVTQTILPLTVFNADPVVTVQNNGAAGGVFDLEAIVTDAGLLDTHTFTWFDSSGTLGTGPTYQAPITGGSAEVSVLVQDDDGGSATVSSLGVQLANEAASNNVDIISYAANVEVMVDGAMAAQGNAQHVFVETGDGVDTITVITDAGAPDIDVQIDAGAGNDIITGGGGNDIITGGPGDDVISGGGGNDILISDEGNDTLDGGDNDDVYTIIGFSDKIIADGAGDDTLNFGSVSVAGGSGEDGISLDLAMTTQQTVYNGATVGRVTLQGTIENVVGTSFKDMIKGNSQNNRLFGGPGDDTIVGSGSQDTLIGGVGRDVIEGGADGNSSIDGGMGDDSLIGGGDDDTLFGGPGDDTIMGAGNETLLGGEGSDVIESGGDDSVDGGDGNDTITSGGDGGDTLFGGPGDDTIIGGGDDTLVGGIGNDEIMGGAGDESIDGGAGNDVIVGGIDSDGGNGDTIFGGPGDDTITGGGNDTLAGGDGSDLIMGGDGIESIDGGSGDDEIVGMGGDDTLFGGPGDDTITGSDDDTILGGVGNDNITGSGSGDESIDGGAGNDMIVGGGSSPGTGDTIFGGPGDDTIHSGGEDTLVGGTGSDHILGSAEGSDSIEGGVGDDILTGGGNTEGLGDTIFGGPGDDTIIGGGTDTLVGGEGNDDITGSAEGNESIEGGEGNDTIFSGGGGDTIFGGPGDDTIRSSGEDTIAGGDGNDTITGGSTGGLNDSIDGGGGDDSIFSGSGSGDTIFGGPGDDTIQSGGGQDTLVGGLGDDDITGSADGDESIFGGVGDDTIDSGGGGDTIFGGDGNDDITGGNTDTSGLKFDTIQGDVGNDFIRAGLGDFDRVFGGPGDDTITGAGHKDTLVGGDGDDTILGSVDGDTSIVGGPGDDTLRSGLGDDDTVEGGAGDDTLISMGGADRLSGGIGNDAVFGSVSGGERISGNEGDDTVNAGGGDGDTIIGGSGSDWLVANGTNLRIDGDDSGVADPTSIDRVVHQDDTNQILAVGGAANEGTLTSNGTLVANLFNIEAASLHGGIGNNTIDARTFAGVVAFFGNEGDDTLLGGSGDDEFDGGIGDDSLHGAGGDDTYYFVGSANLGTDTIDESDPTSIDTLDFFGFTAPVELDLTLADPQVLAAGLLSVKLTNPESIENVVGTVFDDRLMGNDSDNRLVGGGGGDYIYGDGGNDYLTAARVRMVYLDFDSQTNIGAGDHDYTQAERDAIEARMRQDFAAFNVQISQTPPTDEFFVTVLFNAPPVVNGNPVSGGASERIGFRDVQRGGNVLVDVNSFIGDGGNQLPEEEDTYIALSSTIASHELAHTYGVRHQDAFGAPGDGLFSGLNRSQAFLPAYQGPIAADETSEHLIASPASVGTTLADAIANPYFGEREALKLAFSESGSSQLEVANAQKTAFVTVDGVPRAAQDLGPMLPFAVPNTIENPLAFNYDATGAPLSASVHNVIGEIELDGAISENDLYAFDGVAGDEITVEVYSSSLRDRIDNTIDSLLRVYDVSGNIVPYYGSPLGAFNDDGFEPTDSVLVNLQLPVTGKYFVEVDTFNFGIAELPGYVPDFDAVGFCSDRVGDVRCDDTDTGGYELFLYRFNSTPITIAGGDVLIGGAGIDTLVTSTGNDSFLVDVTDVLSGPSAPETVTVNQPPSLAPLTNQLASLNVPVQFTAVGTDADLHDQIEYDLQPTASGLPFPAGAAIDPLTGMFDWTPVANGSYEVLVVVSDLHDVQATQAVRIDVGDSQPPTDVTLTAASVNENVAAGTVVGTVAVTDATVGDVHTLQLTDDAGGLFVLVGNQVQVAAGAVLDFESTPSYDVTIRAIDTSGAQIDKTISIGINDLPEIDDIEIDDGDEQRSVVRHLVVKFDDVVTIAADAFELVQRGTGGTPNGVVATTFTTAVENGKTVATITFSGALTRDPLALSAPLSNGNYELIVRDNKVLRAGVPIDGDYDGIIGGESRFGDEEVDDFYTLYGDEGGTREVGALDFVNFRKTFGKRPTDLGYDFAYDQDNDGDVDLRDYLFFRRGFGTRVDFE